MDNVIPLKAEMRYELGTRAARSLRRNNKVPAIIYGNKSKAIAISVEEKTITKFYRKPHFITQVIKCSIEEKSYMVLPKMVELHPITDRVSHVDFILLDKKYQKIDVPIVYTNRENSMSLKRGGNLNIIKRKLKICCPIENLPSALEVDVSAINIKKPIKALQVILPSGAKLLEKANTVIVSVIGQKGKEEIEESTVENAKDQQTAKK